MSTLDQRFIATSNRLIGTEDLGLRGFDYVRGLVLEGIKQTFQKDIVFGSVKLGLSADGVDKFKVDGTAIATDGSGNMLDIANSGFSTGIEFENVTGQDYDIGLGFAEVPAGVQIGVRSGNPEYVAFEEQVGKSADPDSVVDNGGVTITFVVDSVTEVGVTNAGRKVRVFKKVPGKTATTEVIAVEELTVAFVGGKNQVTTADTLGQPTISTVPSDYTVVLMGPIVKRDSGLISAPGVVFLGTIDGKTGLAPDTFNLGGQDLFDFSFADLGDFTRRDGGSNLLKIDVKADALDVTTSQIQVQNPAAAVVWSVDGNGKVFVTSVSSDLVPSLDGTKDIGSVTKRWLKGWFGTLDVAGNIEVDGSILPVSPGADFIGSDSDKWHDAFAKRIGLGPSSTTFPTPGDPDQFDTIFKLRDLGLSDGGVAVDWVVDTPSSYSSPPGIKTALGIRLEGKVTADLSSFLRVADLELAISGDGDVTLAESLALTTGQNAGTADVATMSTLHLLQKSVVSITGDRHGLLVDDVPSAGVAGTAFTIKTGLGLAQFGENISVLGDATVLGTLFGSSGTLTVGDTIEPIGAGRDIGGIGVGDRWQNVYCEQVRPSNMPVGSMYNATAYNASQDDLTASFAPVVFNSFPILDGGMTQSLNRFTVPNKGTYWVSYTIPLGDSGTQTSTPTVVQGKCVINAGGSPDTVEQSFSQATHESTNNRDCLAASFPVKLDAGDTIEVQVHQRDVDGGVPSQFANVKNRDDADQFAHPQFSIKAVSITD